MRFIRYSILILLIPITGWFVWLFYNKNSIGTKIPITIGLGKTPSIPIEIQGNRFLLNLDYGSKFELILSKEILASLKKESRGRLITRDAKGNTYESDAFVLTQVNIGNRKIAQTTSKELEEAFVKNTTLYTNMSESDLLKDKNGSIGRGILAKMSVLLDLHNHFLLEAKDLNTLIKSGLFPEKYLAIPCREGRTGLILDVETDLGFMRLSLDTCASLSLVRASGIDDTTLLENHYGMDKLTSQKLVIEGRDFGRTDLYLYEITPELDEIDGVLGMNFLEGRILYIDYPKRMIYIGE